MSFVRRSLAALSGLFLLQLSLLGSGTLCPMHHATGNADAGVHAMHGASGMSGMSSPERASSPRTSIVLQADGPASPTDCGGQSEGCGLPWSAGQCSSMTACQISANPAESGLAGATSAVLAVIMPSPALIHSGPTFAPELPPPRA